MYEHSESPVGTRSGARSAKSDGATGAATLGAEHLPGADDPSALTDDFFRPFALDQSRLPARSADWPETEQSGRPWGHRSAVQYCRSGFCDLFFLSRELAKSSPHLKRRRGKAGSALPESPPGLHRGCVRPTASLNSVYVAPVAELTEPPSHPSRRPPERGTAPEHGGSGSHCFRSRDNEDAACATFDRL